MIHVVICLMALVAVILKKDIKHWEKFHSTIWFYVGGNLLYNFICSNYWFWQMVSSDGLTHTQLEMLYTFVAFPATLIMFMNNYPNTFIGKIYHYIFWCGLYITIEFYYQLNGYIVYANGWGFGCSFLFVLIMFPMFRLHYKNPLLAYILAVFIVAFVVWFFNVPFTTPIEER